MSRFTSSKDRGWEFVENCSYTVLEKATCDVDSNDQSFMDNRLQWADVKSRPRTHL